jgi:hypothetical protein
MTDPQPVRASDVSERELREAELSLTTPAPKGRPFGGFVAAAPENAEPPVSQPSEPDVPSMTEEQPE